MSGHEPSLTRDSQPIYEQGNETPILVVGIIAAILLAAGLLPPYWELWKRRGRVIGINWVCTAVRFGKRRGGGEEDADYICCQVFLAMDWSGAFFSLMALGE